MPTDEESKAKRKLYYEKNKEKVREWGKKYRAEKREEIKERKRLYHEANKDTVNAKCRAYHQEHKEEANASRREYYVEHREEAKVKGALYREPRREEAKERSREWREEDPQRLKESLQRSYIKHREERIAAVRAYKKTPTGKEVNYKAYKKYKEENPEKFRSQRLLKQAIRARRLIRQPCEVCGDVKSHGHHDSYAVGDELKVRWLCDYHHKLHEGKIVVPREEHKLISAAKAVLQQRSA